MNLKNNIIKIAIGTILLIPAITLILHSNLGTDPLGCLIDSLSNTTYNSTTGEVFISYGVMLSIINICFLTFHFIRNRNIKFVIFGFLMSLTLGTGIDLCTKLMYLIPNDVLVIQILIFILGFVSMCLGIAFIQSGRIQKMPFEGFQEALSDIVNKDINVVRVYVEIVLMVIAVLIYLLVKFVINTNFIILESVNVGSILIMLLTGPTVNLIYKKLQKGESKNEQVN